MISLTSKTSDGNAFLVFEELPETDDRSSSSRMSRTPTLDGAGVLENQGFSVSDMIIRVQAELTAAEADTLWYMYKNHTDFYLSTRDGVFRGALQNVNVNKNPSTFIFYVIEEVS